jgi:hypothetical protein
VSKGETRNLNVSLLLTRGLLHAKRVPKKLLKAATEAQPRIENDTSIPRRWLSLRIDLCYNRYT